MKKLSKKQRGQKLENTTDHKSTKFYKNFKSACSPLIYSSQ